MSCLSWNCRGLRNLYAVHVLQCLIIHKDLTVVFLCETKSNVRHMERLRMKLNFDKSFTVASDGNLRGLCVLWKEKIDLRLRSYSKHHVDFDVKEPGDSSYWRLIGFYGYPTISDRSKSWQLLDSLCGEEALPWMCIGNFNEILQAHEQEKGNIRSENQMKSFRNIVEACRFKDLGYSGNIYMCLTTLRGGIKVRLDRALGNQAWIDLFPSFRMQHLNKTSSDHVPILLTWNVRRIRRGKKQFCYDEAWNMQEGCDEVVQQG
ncbi:hypothetical protein ACFX13_038442 [Malus domestica]